MNWRERTNAALLLVLAAFSLFEFMLHWQSETFREDAALVLSLQGMLLACLALWCGTFLLLTFGLNDLPLIGLLLIVIAAYFIAQAARPATDALTLLAGVTLGRGASFALKENGKWKMEDGRKKLEARSQKSEVSIFLVGIVALLAFSSWWHLDMTYNSYLGPRWMGLWKNPNIYGMLMSAGVVLSAGLVAVNLKFEKLKAEIEKRREENQKAESREQKRFQIWKVEGRKQKLLMAFLLVAALMMGVGLVMSYSRGAWCGTAVGLLYLAWSYGRLKWRYVLPGVAVAAAVVFFFWNATPDNAPWYVKRLDLGRPSAQHRVAAWRGALQMMRDHPFGVGWNNAVTIYEKNYSPPEDGATAITTNGYLMIGTQLGWPGLICFVSYAGLALKSGKRKAESGNERSCDARVAESQGDASSPDAAAKAVTQAISSGDGGVAGTFCDEASQLRVACRAGALGMVVSFWFDGGLFTLATASVFWVL
jgi:hypothetical protein